jgi:FixJ family two-component response regulator
VSSAVDRPEPAAGPADRPAEPPVAAPAIEPTVFVVDDDPALLRLIRKLLESSGRRVETFPSATEFLEAYRPERPGCLVLDVRMPGMSGLALQERLAAAHCTLPILIVTGYGDVPVAVQAMRQGAFDFIEKPFSGQILIERIEAAVAMDARVRRKQLTREQVERRRETLTPRERQVMDLVAEGKPNKVIGSLLGLSPKTVEVHRANVMRKMDVDSLAELVRVAVLLSRPDEDESSD